MSDEEKQDRRSMFALVILHAMIIRDGAAGSRAAEAVAKADELSAALDAQPT